MNIYLILKLSNIWYVQWETHIIYTAYQAVLLISISITATIIIIII